MSLARCRVCGAPVDVVVRTERGTQCAGCAAVLIDAQWERIDSLTRWLKLNLLAWVLFMLWHVAT